MLVNRRPLAGPPAPPAKECGGIRRRAGDVARDFSVGAQPFLEVNPGRLVAESVAGGRCRQQQHSDRLHNILQLPRTKPAGPRPRAPDPPIREMLLLPACHRGQFGRAVDSFESPAVRPSERGRLNRSVRLTDKLYRTRSSFAQSETTRTSRDCRVEERFSRFPNRLPDLRLLTPSDYDRAFLSNPLRNCPTSQPCLIIEPSPSALDCSVLAAAAVRRCLALFRNSAAASRCRHARRSRLSRRQGRRRLASACRGGRPAGIPQLAAEEPPTEAERAIDEAIRKIAKLQSVAAKIEQDVEMLNQKFKITGDYMKAPEYARLPAAQDRRRAFPIPSGQFLQVCDGETLWEYELVLDQPFYRKLSIKPILERLNSPDLDPEIRTKAIDADGRGRARNTSDRSAKDPAIRPEGRGGPGRPEGLEVSRNLEEPARADVRLSARQSDRRLAALHPDGCARLYLGVDDGWPYQLILEGRKLRRPVRHPPKGPGRHDRSARRPRSRRSPAARSR